MELGMCSALFRVRGRALLLGGKALPITAAGLIERKETEIQRMFGAVSVKNNYTL